MTGGPGPDEFGAAEVDPGQVRTAHGEEPPEAAAGPRELAATATRPAPVTVVAQQPPPPSGGRRWLRRVFWWSLGLFAVAAIAWDTVAFLAGAFARNTAAGATFSLLAAAAAISGVAIILREISTFGRSMRRLREVEATSARAAALIEEDGTGEALRLATIVLAPYEARPDMAKRLKAFRASVTTAHSDAQVLRILADTVVRPLDAQAYTIVAQASRDTAVGVALSPFGLLDAGLVVWRTLGMVRDVAAIYGFRPGFFGRVSLVKRILSAAATAGAGDFIADILAAQAGARLGSLFSVKAGEGILTGVRTARLGLVTMAACRPIPFTEEDRASIARLGREILKAAGNTGED